MAAIAHLFSFLFARRDPDNRGVRTSPFAAEQTIAGLQAAATGASLPSMAAQARRARRIVEQFDAEGLVR